FSSMKSIPKQEEETQTHKFMDGRVNVYKRPNSSYWQCSTYMQGRNWRSSTKEESLQKAKEFAEEWFLDLYSLKRAGALKKKTKSFRYVAEKFMEEYIAITVGQRSEK